MYAKQKYYHMYTRAKRECHNSVIEEKKSFNVTEITQPTNTCKAAWEIVNPFVSGPKIKIPAISDEFNYFVGVVEDAVANLPMLQFDPVAALPDGSPLK